MNEMSSLRHTSDSTTLKPYGVMISVVHPAARPIRLPRIIRTWTQRAADPSRVEYIVCCHRAQSQDFRQYVTRLQFPELGGLVTIEQNGPNHPTVNNRSSFVDNTNHAAFLASGEILVLAADDLTPPDHWDRQIRDRLAKCDDPRPSNLSAGDGPPLAGWEQSFILRCSNGDERSDRRKLILHPIMTRARYREQGWFFCPAYSGMFADNDLTERAERDRVILEAPAIVFQHGHPFFGTAPADPVYRWQNSPAEYALGQQTFERRQKQGFPIGPNWEQIGQMIDAVRPQAERG